MVNENRRRGGSGQEFELLDTGIFNEDRYFDIFIEYAKASAEDIAIRIEIFNRGPADADFGCFPTCGSATPGPGPIRPIPSRPSRSQRADLPCADDSAGRPPRNLTVEYRLGPRYLASDPGATPLFTDNETNAPRVFGPGNASRKPYVKDAFHRHIVHGEQGAANPEAYRNQSLSRITRF